MPAWLPLVYGVYLLVRLLSLHGQQCCTWGCVCMLGAEEAWPTATIKFACCVCHCSCLCLYLLVNISLNSPYYKPKVVRQASKSKPPVHQQLYVGRLLHFSSVDFSKINTSVSLLINMDSCMDLYYLHVMISYMYGYLRVGVCKNQARVGKPWKVYFAHTFMLESVMVSVGELWYSLFG